MLQILCSSVRLKKLFKHEKTTAIIIHLFPDDCPQPLFFIALFLKVSDNIKGPEKHSDPAKFFRKPYILENTLFIGFHTSKK